MVHVKNHPEITSFDTEYLPYKDAARHMTELFKDKTQLLLDMNGTFMFGEDQFDDGQDYFQTYRAMNGELSSTNVNEIIRRTYRYLDQRYPLPEYRESFPSVRQALDVILDEKLAKHEMDNLVSVFTQHEIGDIPVPYQNALKQLSQKYTLALVIDIWSPKQAWLNLFEHYGLSTCFSLASFSSDHGMVKPSPIPIENLVKQLQTTKENCLMIGDSIRRDLGAAVNAQIDCVLVGGQQHPQALACYDNLLLLAQKLL